MPSTGRTWACFCATIAVLIVATIAGLSLGSSTVGVADIAHWATGGEVSGRVANILVNVRIPRVAAALLAGAALSASGFIIQTVLDNPMASPNVIGVNAGAGLAVLIAASVAPHAAAAVTPLAAFAGALATALIVFALANGAGASRLAVVLVGLAITTVLTAGMNVILIVNPDAYVGSSRFLTGGLSGVLLSDLAMPAIFAACGLACAIGGAHHLAIMQLGDQSAHALGMNVKAFRLIMLAVAALLAGSAVSFAGMLGFVGLIVPHMARFLLKRSGRSALVLSVIMGAAFVVACDLVARVAFAPYEIPVGIIMAFLGGPFFIYLVFRNRRYRFA